MEVKRRKMLLAIAVSMFMLLGFLPGVAVADDPVPIPNFWFIPNSDAGQCIESGLGRRRRRSGTIFDYTR